MKLFYVIFFVFLSTINLFAVNNAERGPYGKIFYGNKGFGRMYVPYYYSTYDFTVVKSTNRQDDADSGSTASAYMVTLGYYYDLFQIEMRYFNSSVLNQTFETGGIEIFLESDLSYFDFNGGLRFSNPGNSTYHYLFTGGRQMYFDTEYNNTSAKGLGYHLGYSGFASFGLSYSLEFVLTGDFLFGYYRKNSISSDVNVDKKKKDARYMSFAIGIGVQYEPYNISFVLKLINEINYIKYSGDSGEIAGGAYETIFGFEVIYSMPGIKYNK